MFCRKVNIPFIVYGFGAAANVKCIDAFGQECRKPIQKTFSREDGQLAIHSVYLREYLNSKMSNAEFTKAMKHMLLIKESFECNKSNPFANGRVPRFETEDLSNTPLTEALVATAEIMKDFKQKNNLDITNLVIVHDGDADFLNSHCSVEKKYNSEDISVRNRYFEHLTTNYYLIDNKNKFVKQITKNSESIFQNVMSWFTKVTDSKVFGFFICDTYRGAARYAIENRYYVNDVPLSEMRTTNYYQYKELLTKKQKELRSEKFLDSKSPGYHSFFLIAGGNELSTEDEEIEIEGKMTTKKLVSAFAKYNKKKAVNRVLVSKFIQGIAA
jgi:hypothetical protein